jgi:hypothetical protein
LFRPFYFGPRLLLQYRIHCCQRRAIADVSDIAATCAAICATLKEHTESGGKLGWRDWGVCVTFARRVNLTFDNAPAPLNPLLLQQLRSGRKDSFPYLQRTTPSRKCTEVLPVQLLQQTERKAEQATRTCLRTEFEPRPRPLHCSRRRFRRRALRCEQPRVRQPSRAQTLEDGWRRTLGPTRRGCAAARLGARRQRALAARHSAGSQQRQGAQRDREK